jgi:hypothetical protein
VEKRDSRVGVFMGDVVAFRRKLALPVEDEESEIDLITALDVAIRDLSDLSLHLTTEDALSQALACRSMLQRAFAAALQQA